ncbi:helix-turn-helix domain-containing protein [Clostridium perfringens]|nr:helix-turn-helix domain-containing protein [Clostridium perfringens]
MKVKIARIKKGITQQQLCKIVKTSPKKLVEIERGNYDMVTIGLAKKIAAALDTTVQDLFFSYEE